MEKGGVIYSQRPLHTMQTQDIRHGTVEEGNRWEFVCVGDKPLLVGMKAIQLLPYMQICHCTVPLFLLTHISHKHFFLSHLPQSPTLPHPVSHTYYFVIILNVAYLHTHFAVTQPGLGVQVPAHLALLKPPLDQSALSLYPGECLSFPLIHGWWQQWMWRPLPYSTKSRRQPGDRWHTHDIYITYKFVHFHKDSRVVFCVFFWLFH